MADEPIVTSGPNEGASSIIPQLIEEELQKSYLDYSMSVIIGRALPDIRDGLKPVHRRILYAMSDLAMRYNQPYKKCARIVGECLGKYHPHGDQSVYDALVRMAQDFSLRQPLIDGQGNFGCFTKDTKVQLTDGRQVSFGDLIAEDRQGKKNYTYTIDSQGAVKIALIKSPRLTRKNAQIMKVVLDNGQEIKCTLNHKFMLRDQSYLEAENLKAGMSLMPLYLESDLGIMTPKESVGVHFNHKITSTEILNEYVDVFDITIDGTHNFALAAGVFVHNSVDGDSPAAMRYTEARLSKIADEMLQDLDKETVDMVENFDGSLKEPSVLPAKLPNLLVNGSSGIAVGMATNIPPHNLAEVTQALIAVIDRPDIEIMELAKIMPGPDFPTGGIIQGRTGIMQYYSSGRGKLRVKSVITQETTKTGKGRLIISELPYQLNKADLVTEIADAVKDKKIDGISDIRDESDRDGMRIVIELKKDASPEIVENMLMHNTRVQVTFGVIMLSIVDGQPKILGLRQILDYYLLHRRTVVRKRTEYDLRKASDKEHLLEGLVIALDHIDKIIALIKGAKNTDEARTGLMDDYKLSEKQSNAILDMRLAKLTGLEQTKIRAELDDIKIIIIDLKDILANEHRILTIIRNELKEIGEAFASRRKTHIQEGGEEQIDLEDLIEPEDVVVTISAENYCKRMPVSTYRSQNRGGKGITAATTKEEDVIQHLFIANTHSWLLVFTDKGKVYWTKVYNIPEGSRQGKGKPIINIVKVQPGEKVQAVIPVKDFPEDKFLLFSTKNGIVKKTALSAYGNVRQGGIAAINIEEHDDLVTVLLTSGHDTIFLASAKGMAVRFSEEDVRPTGRNSTGVIGIRMEEKDVVVGAIISHENHTILTITENGYGKRTVADEYRHISRGGKGVINIITSERNGKVATIKAVDETKDVMLISKNGITIRTPVSGISVIGRNTQGVRLMNLNSGDKVVACTVVDHDAEEAPAEVPLEHEGDGTEL